MISLMVFSDGGQNVLNHNCCVISSWFFFKQITPVPTATSLPAAKSSEPLRTRPLGITLGSVATTAATAAIRCAGAW